MSKIFEVLSKDNLLDLQEVSNSSELEQLATPAKAFEETSTATLDTGVPAPARPESAVREVSLRASALTPVFPFFDEMHSAAAEQYRIIRTKLLHSPKKARVIVVSSPSSGDGKTISSINIAASLSLKENFSVLLVDADLRRPAIADLLGLSSTPGLADVLSGRATLNAAMVHPVEFPNLCILPAGDGRHAAAELLASERWPGIIEQFRTQFDLVIVDATPIAVVADFELLQHVSDGVVVVVRPDHTDRTACLTALRSVTKEKFIGIVLNCLEDWLFCKTYHYEYYGKNSKSTLTTTPRV